MINNSNPEAIIIPHKVANGVGRIKNIKNIIAITSGKGGVGKSTVALNLALSLAKHYSYKVGLLDADIYGPSIPTLVGALDYKPEVESAKFVPLNKFKLEIMSFGFLIDKEKPAIWRGAIVTKALEQLLFDTNWSELDFLIIDMPPGTGDIHLSMCQKFPLTANVVVTTPHALSEADVLKSINMYKKLAIPSLGIVENMTNYMCNNCGHVDDLHFSTNDNTNACYQELKVLANLPLSFQMSSANHTGVPILYLDQNQNDENNHNNAQNINIMNKYTQLESMIKNLAQNFLNEIKLLPKEHQSKLKTIPIKLSK